MKGSSVFYLCLFMAILFYALGVYSGYWFFIKWITFGFFLLKMSIWGIVLAGGALLLWWLFHKREKNGE
jgi:hypothetical protein